MKPENARLLVDALKEAGINFVAIMPDSIFKDAQKMVMEEKDIICVPVSNEATGVAICSGAWAGGKKPALLIPTAGLLVASWPLTSLNMAFEMPILLVVAYRGDLGDDFWYMRPYKYTTEPLLNVLQIPYKIVDRPEDVKRCVKEALRSCMSWLRPVALLITGEVLW